MDFLYVFGPFALVFVVVWLVLMWQAGRALRRDEQDELWQNEHDRRFWEGR